MNPLLPHLEADDDALQARWERLQVRLAKRFGRMPGIEGILFLVGIQARGRGFEPGLAKEAKQDLIMEGTYRVFASLGVYRRIADAPDGRETWERLIPHPPDLSVDAQEKLLRTAILHYFDDLLT